MNLIKNWKRWGAIALTLGLVACGDDDITMDTGPAMDGGTDMMTMSDVDPDGDMTPDMAMETDAGPDAPIMMDAGPELPVVLAPVATAPALGVISTDFATTASLGLLNSEGASVVDEWIHSGTVAAGLTSTFGGDVVFPTATPEGTVGVLDRTEGVVTRFEVSTGGLFGQLRVENNPHDMWANGARGFISRNGGFMASGNPDDLIGFNPYTMELNGEAIDLTVASGTAIGLDCSTDPCSESEVHVQARPSRIVQVGNTLVVGLDRIRYAASPRAHLPGAVALVDLNTLEVSLSLLEGGANCGQVAPIPGAGNLVAVGCKGWSDIAYNAPDASATAGLYILTIEDGAVTNSLSWQPEGDDPVAVSNIMPVNETQMAAVALGSFDPAAGDELVLVDLSDGTQVSLLTAAQPFSIDQGVWFMDHFYIRHDGTMSSISLTGERTDLAFTSPNEALTHSSFVVF